MTNMNNLLSGKNKVAFKSGNVSLAGLLFLPENFDANKKYPTIIYSGPMTQIKDQTGAYYGEKFARKGYVYLSFDHEGFGESEGELRVYENHQKKMENIRDAISYLRTLEFVDRDHFYGLGICASGSNLTTVAITDKRMKAVATISGYMSKTENFFLQPKETVLAMLSAANEARQRYYETGEAEYIDIMGMESMNLDELDKDSVFYGAVDFYLTSRGGQEKYPNYSHKGPLFFLEQLSNNEIILAKYLYTPYLGVYGSKADTAPLTTEFYENCSEPKELFEIQGANHLDLYDKDVYADQAVEKIDEFFRKY